VVEELLLRGARGRRKPALEETGIFWRSFGLVPVTFFLSPEEGRILATGAASVIPSRRSASRSWVSWQGGREGREPREAAREVRGVEWQGSGAWAHHVTDAAVKSYKNTCRCSGTEM
jgi:hypothetical protein